MSNAPTPTPTFAEAMIACAVKAVGTYMPWEECVSRARQSFNGWQECHSQPPAIRAALALQPTASYDICLKNARFIRAKISSNGRLEKELAEAKALAQKRLKQYGGALVEAMDLERERDEARQERDALRAKCERLERESNTAGRRLEQIAAELSALQSAPKPEQGMAKLDGLRETYHSLDDLDAVAARQQDGAKLSADDAPPT